MVIAQRIAQSGMGSVMMVNAHALAPLVKLIVIFMVYMVVVCMGSVAHVHVMIVLMQVLNQVLSRVAVQ